VPPRTLSQFGGTDAEVSNNSSDHASVPQALEMLNGDKVKKVSDKHGYVAKLIKDAVSPSERLDILFLSVYSRYPTEIERVDYIDYMKKENAKRLFVLVKAMINSKSFIFVQ